MKKFFKVFVIVVLVIGVIVGTCFFFFRKHEVKKNTTESLVNYFNSESSIKFRENINKMSQIVNSDGTDNRLSLIIETNNKLDTINNDLISYYIEADTKIYDEEISRAVSIVKSSKSTLSSMMKEYEIKSTSKYFDRHLGANDFYMKASSYLTQYAKLVKLINNDVSADKNADVKFNLYEVYSNVVIETFSYINSEDSTTKKVVVGNISNIVILNSRLVIVNSIVQTSSELYSKNNNEFNKYYEKCNKAEFASKLAENIGVVKNAEQDSNEKIATYYFKVIMGL